MTTMATCGKCTATNVTVSHVRACYGQAGGVATTTRDQRVRDRLRVTHEILHGDPNYCPRCNAGNPYVAHSRTCSKYETTVEVPGLGGLRVPEQDHAVRDAGERLRRTHQATQSTPDPWAQVDALRAQVAEHLHYETRAGGKHKRMGRFAVEIDGVLKFLVIKKILNGRYAGRMFVDSMGSDTAYPVQKPGTLTTYLTAVLVDPVAAAKRYADELDQCSDCGRTLTNEESRLRGIGPECWAKR